MIRMGWISLLLIACWVPTLAGAVTVARARPEDRAVWVERIAQTNRALFDARIASAVAKHEYMRMRHDKSVRGSEKVEVLSKQAEASQKLLASEAILEELLQLARRSGVPPGWIREGLETPANLPDNVIFLDKDEEDARKEVAN